MAEVIHGSASVDVLKVDKDKTQVYGLKGNDTIVSESHTDVLLIGGSGNDKLIMSGGNGTLSGGDGKDTIELHYSDTKSLSAVIEDFDPSSDKIVVNFDGNTEPKLDKTTSGNDVIWSDSTGNLNVTLKGVRENDYFDGTSNAANDERYFEILELTNNERENPTSVAGQSIPEVKDLPWLTLSDGLTQAAEIRAKEIAALGASGQLDVYKHTRPDGTDFSTVFNDEIGKDYSPKGENLNAGFSTAAEAMSEWIKSETHHKNILSVNPNDNSSVDYLKLGVGYQEYDAGGDSDSRWYWTQLFGGNIFGGNITEPVPETVDVSTVQLSVATVSTTVTLTEGTLKNTVFGATIQGTNGDDKINNSGFKVSISGAGGNDSIVNRGSFTTINAGTGDDQISLNGAQNVLIQYASGEGNDTISGFHASDTVSISGDEFTPAQVGDDIIVTVGSDSITLLYAARDGVQLLGSRSKLYIGTVGNDSINVSNVDNATIKPLGGNDTISGFNDTSRLQVASGSYASVADHSNLILTNGTDTINLLGAAGLSINIADANGKPITVGNALDIVGTEDADELSNTFDRATIRALGGDDTITNRGKNVAIYGGSGIDYVYNNDSRQTTYTYESGDDTIEGFNDSDKLYIGGYSYSTATRGNDIIVSIIDNAATVGTVTLKDYPAEQEVNIKTASNPGEDIYNENGNTIVTGTPNDDTITNDGYNVTINALAGDDEIDNYGDNVTINGDAGDDTITDHGNNNISIDGGAGDDYITTTYNTYSESTVYSGSENADYASSVSEADSYASGINVTVNGGAGNDTIINHNVYGSILGGAGDDYIENNTSTAFFDGSSIESSDLTIDGGTGDDIIDNTGSVVTIFGGAGDDSINNVSTNVTILGDADNDTIENSGAMVSISGGAGNDFIDNSGANVTILGDAGNDSIRDRSSNGTILGGTGDDRITLSSGSHSNYLRYAQGDGNDTVWGISTNDTFNFLLGGASAYSVGSGNDLIVNIRTSAGGELLGSITFKDGRNKAPKFTFGESNTSGGIQGDSDGGNSSPGNPGDGGGGGGNTSGGTSSNEGNSSAASGGRSASGSSGRSVAVSGGNGRKRNEHSTTENASTVTAATSTTNPLATPSTASTTTQQTSTATQRVYTGGNQVISDYTSGERIVFGTTYTGAFYDGNGNFFAGSTTGALVVQNAVNKVIDLKDAAGNDFVKAYAATTAGVIDGRGLGGFEVINGSAGADAIYAGDGGSQLWGGADSVSDAMMGGNGTDIFIGGKNQGADFFLNASSADVVHLNDSTLSDIVATAEENGTIGIAFNTGNVVAIQSSEALSATVMLADGSAYRYNHANKSWQSA